MQSWEIKILEPYFNLIASGIKTVIGRPRFKLWSEIDVGDRLIVHSNGEKRSFEVISLCYVRSFTHLHKRYNEQLLLDYKHCSLHEVWGREYGVVGIKIKSTYQR